MSSSARDLRSDADARTPKRARPNMHPNPLSQHSEDYPDPTEFEAEQRVGMEEQL